MDTIMNSAVDTSATLECSFPSERIEKAFAKCFARDYNTRLRGGAQEPLYEPASNSSMATLHYRHDFFASALHEVAHWCIAGEERRRQVDFGYWYAEDGRSQSQQRQFESVEYKPQALEWFFSRACGWHFKVSVDNLDPASGLIPDTRRFCQMVVKQAQDWSETRLPARGEMFYSALCDQFGTCVDSASQTFSPGDLQ
jgi:elongation factor P hydroxylase